MIKFRKEQPIAILCFMVKIMKNVTIYTLAEELNMNPTIVSRAFNPNANVSQKKRELILKTAKKYNFVPNKMASRLSMREIKIGVLLYFHFEPFYSELIKGINAAHESLKDYKIKCDLRFLDKHRHTIDECREVLNELAEYDGIIVGGLSDSGDCDVLDEIYRKNTNLVLLHTDSLSKKRLFGSFLDDALSAEIAAEFLHNCLYFSKRRNVVLFTGDTSSDTHKCRLNSFLSASEEYGFNILEVYNMEDSSDRLREICNNQLSNRLSEIDGIYITSGNSTELCGFLEQNNCADSIALVTFDTYPKLNEYIKKGVINATVYQNLFGQAKSAYENLFYHISENREVPDVIGTHCELVMKHNLHLYTE